MEGLLLIFLIYLGIGIGGLRYAVQALKDDLKRSGQLEGDKNAPPALPPASPDALAPRSNHPYRPRRDPDQNNSSVDTSEYSEEERFFRFSYVITRISNRVDPFELKRIAESFELPFLLDLLDGPQPKGAQLDAVVATFKIRTWPGDLPALVDLLYESQCSNVIEAVLHVLRERGVGNMEVVIAIFDLIYGDYENVEEFMFARRLAEDIFSEWEEKYPDMMMRFGLLE
jgi:hypothetical protein